MAEIRLGQTIGTIYTFSSSMHSLLPKDNIFKNIRVSTREHLFSGFANNSLCIRGN